MNNYLNKDFFENFIDRKFQSFVFRVSFHAQNRSFRNWNFSGFLGIKFEINHFLKIWPEQVPSSAKTVRVGSEMGHVI